MIQSWYELTQQSSLAASAHCLTGVTVRIGCPLGGKVAASWESQCSLLSQNDCIHVRWPGSSCNECWQIGPSVGRLGCMLCSHALGCSIKHPKQSTLDYLSCSFPAIECQWSTSQLQALSLCARTHSSLLYAAARKQVAQIAQVQ